MAETRFSPYDARARAARRAIGDLVAQELPARELLDEVEARLRPIVPFQSGGWWTTDPETLLPTDLQHFDLEAVERELAQERGVRFETFDGNGRRIGPDLRVVARSGENVWGSACLTRAAEDRPFSTEEIKYVIGIADSIGFALRADLLRIATTVPVDSSRGSEAPGFGTLILGDDDVIEGFTAEAKQWLVRLGVADLSAPLPSALRWISLQARARGLLLGTDQDLRPARSRWATTTGEFVVVQAEILQGSRLPKVVMSLAPASGESLWPLLLALHDLTTREQAVAGLVVAGRPLEQIAAELGLSLHTVRDHVKAVYAKVGVRSRPELTARLSGLPARSPSRLPAPRPRLAAPSSPARSSGVSQAEDGSGWAAGGGQCPQGVDRQG